MIRNIQEIFKITATLVIGSIILWSCEPDADQLGSQFFQNGVEGIETSYPVIAYNDLNGDTIRTDAARLQNATLGAFRESQFGLQKLSYVSQVRLSAYAPDFGANPILDSAVLVIRPQYSIDSVTAVTDEAYIFPTGAIPAKKVVSTFPISKYGNTKISGNTIFNFKVEEVTDFLFSNMDMVKSNKVVATGATIGTKSFDGKVRGVKVTQDSDNSILFESDAAIRIPLDSLFITNKILKKGSIPELADAASFIRYFKGIKVSVIENDGYIFPFDPSTVEIKLYYKNDKVDNGVTTRVKAVYPMNLGSANAKYNKIDFDRVGTPTQTIVKDTINGSPKVYAQGMGGPGIGLKVPEATMATVRSLYQNDKIGIVSAKIRIYTDVTSWNNKLQKPYSFVVKEKVNKVNLNSFLEDMSTLYATGIYNLVKAYDLEKNRAYYDIGITQTFKNAIEGIKDRPKTAHFVLNVGTYSIDQAGSLIGALYPNLGSQNFNNRSYSPQRAVFVGTDLVDLSNKKSARLILTYGKK